MKCPNCGFVSYPGLTQCKKCGKSFVRPARKASSPMDKSFIAPQDSAQERKDVAGGLPPTPRDSALNLATGESVSATKPQTMPLELKDEFAEDLREHLTGTAKPLATEGSVPWRQELSARVQSYRQRRPQLRNDQNLEFPFQQREADVAWETDKENALEFPQKSLALDAEITPTSGLSDEAEHWDVETPQEDAEIPQEDSKGLEIYDSALAQTNDFALEPASPASDHIEVLIEPAEVDAAVSQLEYQGLPVAPLGRRFQAGLIDGLILLLAAAVFALITWLAGTRLTLVPLNVGIAALIAAIFVMAYFGLFTAIASSTPGQIWMGMEVRNMEGWPPLAQESCVRAFGYLVSMSTFMIGFLWALVDSDGLTWHDQISGTFLTPVSRDPDEGAELNVAP